MKRVRTRFMQSLPPVKLYRDGLEHLLELIAGDDLETVGISDGEFTYSDLDDLQKHRGDQIKKLVITREQLLDDVYFIAGDERPFKVWLAAGPEAEDIYLRVKEFLWSKRRAPRPIFGLVIPSKIYLVKRHEVSSFWKRNWEKLLLLVLGALITIGAQWLWGKLVG